MFNARTHNTTQFRSEHRVESGLWSRCTPLEKVGLVALGTVAVIAAAAILAPHFAAATAGGALVGGGARLLSTGLRGN